MRMNVVVPGLALALVLSPAAMAAKPAKPPKPPTGNTAVTIAATPSITVFSGITTLRGRVSGAASGVAVRLEQDDSRPYGDSYRPSTATATTANNGAYALTVKPALNTQYRVIAQTSPPVTSPATLVRVRPRVGINVSDTSPARGSLVTFKGSVTPAHDGRIVAIQKRSSSGGFITVSRTTLRDAGDLKSTYTRRLRVFRDGVYRVKVAGDADHITGFSRLRTLTVHG